MTRETIDAARATDPRALDDLIALHSEAFPTHSHVLPELVEWRMAGGQSDTRNAHLLITYVSDVPAALLIVHMSRPRRIGLVHFLAVDAPFRTTVTGESSLAHALLEAAWEMGTETFGGRWVGLVAESERELVPLWARWGFTDLDVDYAEPYHGMHWARHGPPEFFPMRLVGRATRDIAGLRTAAVEAFLVDHYLLPEDHPTVTRARGTADPG